VGRFCAVGIIAGVLIAAPWPVVSAWAEVLVDPMRPAHYQILAPAEESEGQEVDTTAWSLTAVLSAADRAVAVINGTSVQNGDVLMGYTVMHIEPDRALLHNGEKQLVLHRVGSGLKKNIR